MIISVTEFRKNFGALTEQLLDLEEIILTKGGEPYAIVTPAPEAKKKRLIESFGAWSGTELADEKYWQKILVRKSRKNPVQI